LRSFGYAQDKDAYCVREISYLAPHFTRGYFSQIISNLAKSEREDFAIFPVIARPQGRGNLIHWVLDYFVATLLAMTEETESAIHYFSRDYTAILIETKEGFCDYSKERKHPGYYSVGAIR
jgi:hypothetical protein